MSWSIYNVPVPEAGKDTMDSILAAIDGATEGNPSARDVYELAEVKDQIAAAAAALDELIASGAAGPGPFVANLGGHANPKHEPRQGYANDTVSVTLTQAPTS